MDRVTVPEAAERLGLSENAIRKRVQRDTIPWERDEDGRVYVHLPPTMTDLADDQVGDYAADQSQLFERMASEIDFLRGELQRKDAILLSMTEGLKALEAPPQPRESDLSASDGQGNAVPQDRRSSWWRRFFGFEKPARLGDPGPIRPVSATPRRRG